VNERMRCVWLRCRFAVIWICAAALIVGSVTLPRIHAAEYEAPTLFYNDTAWAKDMFYPSLGYIIGAMEDFWIPLSFLEEIDNIRVKRGAAKNYTVFVIQDTATEKYLSFNINDSSYAQTERGTLILIRTMLYSKERYLPMREMCAYFGWTFEISEDHRTVRICDGKQQKSFAELLSVYEPPIVTETEPVTTTTEAVTEPPPIVSIPVVEITTDVDTTEVVTEPIVIEPPKVIYKSSSVYLTFEDMEATYTPVILDVLKTHGVKATFFVTGEQMSQYPDVLLRILAEGHVIGLQGMTDDETELRKLSDIRETFDEENALLYALVRRKSRLIRMPNGSRSGKFVLVDAQKEALAESGYILWDWNISAMDHDPGYSADMVFAKVDAAMKTSYYPVIRMHCSETASLVLESLLLRFEETGTAAKIISDADTPVVFP